MTTKCLTDRIASDFLRTAEPTGSHSRADYAQAWPAWQSVLGKAQVLCDDVSCQAYAQTTLPQGTRPAGILRPSTADEVSQVVRIAAQHGIRLHAISRGKNWGYGDACAPTDGQVIVELTRMNRIREVHAELGYAVIEPGVSQGQMYNHLRERNLPLLVDITGAGTEASIVGNILQRGFGHTPYGNRFGHTCGLEVVLPNGQLIDTGFEHQEFAPVSRVFPCGTGPRIDGLFTQSHHGIVTAACVWLMPRPEVIEAFAFKVGNDKLDRVVDGIRRLRMQQTVRSAVHIANDLRVISSRMQYPWELAQGLTPLPDAVRQKLRVEEGLGAWNCIGGLYGSDAEVRAARQQIRREFRGTARVLFFGRRKLGLAQQLGQRLGNFRWARRLAATAANAGGVLDLLEGVPNDEHIKGVWWRERQTTLDGPADLRHAGLIWVSPIIPATRHDATRLLTLIEPIFKRFGFDLLITMSSVTERSLICVTSINYDKSDSSDQQRASDCYDHLTGALAQAGYPLYRTSSTLR